MDKSNHMDIRTFEGSKQKAIKWRELYRWKWRGIRTLELDGNYTGGHRDTMQIVIPENIMIRRYDK
jgi:hypothetical protein